MARTAADINESLQPVHLKSIKWGLIGLLFVFLCLLASIGLGAIWISPSVVWDSFVSFQAGQIEHQLIREVRIPRALAAALIGAALAVAGTIMQGITRNPLADPSIIGITHGAGLAIAISLAFVSSGSYWILLIWSFAGSAAGAMLVLSFSMISKERISPVTLTLAGAALSTLFSALSTGIALYFQVAQDLSFWFAGGLSGTKWQHVFILLPAVIIGILLSLWISRSLTILALGEEVAAGLGQSQQKVRWIGLIAVILLSGAAVSIAGAIGFIGLVVPHIVRMLIGSDYRWLIPLSAIAGALLLVLADIGARMINPPFETPVSAVTALIGVPFFLYLSRRKRGYM
ncbi:ferrichrome ABC transporter permease [Cytobacillus firmus]|uniref:FecCD family ABC transporter permease n=1 Tax=Cytobacillus firmus TaxID=1399 RepID=UPI0018CD29F7|nr:iron ABC transporter permease [Cytobacillus firmus]MBG9447992.1 ferrichrome ABC transporter permease [Cytobacillus firmus]URT71351.1 iron ABC transporter permease [Cytobacillus firmus]WHY34649.1 iron ABC transporter permease [Cytobacillus firmus]WHY62261.1 iron ABC transporter permease [Cytobacillus firmus]